VDLEEPAVDAVVVGDDDLGELDVLVLERLEDPVELLEDEVRRAQGALLDRDELGLVLQSVRAAFAQPNLPVTYSRVRSSSGLVKIFCVGANSTSWPTRRPPCSSLATVKNAVMSDTRAACCMLCVTMTIE
jgi:hypothetical protein